MNQNDNYRYSYQLGFYIQKTDKTEKEKKQYNSSSSFHHTSVSNTRDFASIVPDNTPVKIDCEMFIKYVHVLFSGDFHPLRDKDKMNNYLIDTFGWSVQEINEIKYQLDGYAKFFGLSDYLKERRFSNEKQGSSKFAITKKI